MKITYYQDKYFYYFWKPAGIPSTFGKKKSFLDILLDTDDKEIVNIFKRQKIFFDKASEYGLVNRLDNDTSGLLYFAKTPLFKDKYKQAQSTGKTEKYYIADVYGKYSPEQQKISYPIGHHPFSSDRMVVILDSERPSKNNDKIENLYNKSKKIKGKLHYVDTYIKKMYYDEKSNITTLLVTISKGIRHQIRLHLSSIGHPIVGEKIYIKHSHPGVLHLFSIGIKLK